MIRQLHTLFLLFIAIFSIQAISNNAPYTFEKFPFLAKLPSNSVVRIFNDSEGFMWFGTKDGLCRFDGYDVKVFRSSALTPGRLTNNEIQCIAEDKHKNMWVGTGEGINIIDKKGFSISSFQNEFVKKDRINSLLCDSKGDMWIGTSSNGLLRYNVETQTYERYSTDVYSKFRLKGSSVTNIYEDKEGRIWVSLWKAGLSCINAERTKIFYAPQISVSNNPFRVIQDKNGFFWVCTWGDGILQYTVNQKNEIAVKPVVWSANSVKKMDDIVYSITQDDHNGNVWVITFSGLSIIQKEADGSYKIGDTDAFFDQKGNKLFHEIKKDQKGNLWIGSIGEGLYKLDFNRLAIQNFPLSNVKKLLNSQSYVTHFCQTGPQNVLISMSRIGLLQFNTQTGDVWKLTNPLLADMQSISGIVRLKQNGEVWIANEGQDVISVFKPNASNDLDFVTQFPVGDFGITHENTITNFHEERNGNLWIGATRGLFLKILGRKISAISTDITFVNTIEEDINHRIWVGTEKEGVFVFTKSGKGYTKSKVNLNLNNYESNNIQSICCKKNGDVYIGTKEGFLYYFGKGESQARDLSGLYGITDEGISNILEDGFGMLWISTIKKIIRFNPQTHAATYYSEADGMLNNSFFKDGAVLLTSGHILFGGNKGICEFNPSAPITKSKAVTQNVALTDILIQNKSIFDDLPGVSHFNSVKNRLTLNYTESNIGIEFSALDFSSASKIQYAYMLSGVDNDWNYVGNNRRFVNYANLPAGKYKFMVKASDENGLWSNQVTSLTIVVLPPPYKTWWAYLLYLLVFGSIAYFVSRTVFNQLRLRNELKISKIEKVKSEELVQIKLRYFTNISHELLTPLTIITLLIESLQNKHPKDAQQYEIMRGNVNRLKRLIKQILVFRKTESGNMKLRIRENDLIEFVNGICKSNFQPLVKEKEINFSIKSEYESFMAYFDPDKLDKVLYNLLSNAFKHTPKGGEISVKLDFIPRNKEMILRLSVSDSGEGIAEEDLPNIFQRFYISKSSDQSQSNGIGLSLTSDLLNIHKGSIEVKSQLGVGSVFTIEIPVSATAYTDEELSEDEQPETRVTTDLPEILPEAEDDTEEELEELPAATGKTILVVEDNKDLRELIVDYLSQKYQVLAAEDGLLAQEILRQNEVDLVISDVMMPQMDGLTLCKILKNDIATSHLHVLMLTAKNSTEDRIDCYNAGADAYISKPFELRVLEARVDNLIRRREVKKETFKSNQEINISSMEYSSINEEFLKHAVNVVEVKLSDITFDFDQFAIDIGASKSTLHRKLKSLTGLSPGEFIRNIRMKHASKMLVNNVGNISEIAFSVGFNDPKYFSRCFRTEFGMTPREYIESKKAELN